MGVFDKVREVMGGSVEGGQDSRDPPELHSRASIPEWAIYDTAAIPERRDIIAEHYEIDRETAQTVAATIKEHLENNESVSGSALREDAGAIADIPDDQLSRIVRTEVSSIQVLDRVIGYLERERPGDVYLWTGPVDHRTHPMCEEIAEITEAADGVPIDDLQRLLVDQGMEYEDEGGTPNRMDHWVPHEGCRFTVTKHVDF